MKIKAFKFTWTITCLICSLSASAQIQAPEFLCLRGDTLIWELPTNNCGPFVSYDIYTSGNLTGPYALLASVTNPNQTYYIDPNPNNELRYYYLTANYDCPGQTQLYSDTLDNLPPAQSPINYVTIDNGQLTISWTPSPSPEVYAYIIYRRTNLGDVPIDTVFSGNTFIDLSANPDQQTESYFVNALDRCGNTSLFDLRHRSIFLKGLTKPCEQSINLNWNPYQNWPYGVAEQQIWLSIDGGAFTNIASLPPTDSSFVFTGINDGSNYCFFVRNLAATTGYVSNSNLICLDAEIVNPVSKLYVESASVNDDGSTTVRWLWNEDAEIKQYEILRSGTNGNYEVIAIENPVLPLQPLNTFEDSSTQDAGPWYYTIRTTDDCDTVKTSTYGATVFLSGSSSQTGINQLTWTPFDQELSTVNTWELYRLLNTSAIKVASLPGTTNQYTDHYEPATSDGLTACYYVLAKGTLAPPGGNAIEIQSRSNLTCIEQPLRILIPNALAPEGFNQEFKVLVVPDSFSEFDLRIFNRYGQEVFRTSNPDEGWRGTHNGKKLPQGAYVYTLRIRQSNGHEEYRRGTLLLLR